MIKDSEAGVMIAAFTPGATQTPTVGTGWKTNSRVGEANINNTRPIRNNWLSLDAGVSKTV